ncbi:hypothetical protein GCM10011571_11870 [Marinithermofilum abyssi]|uniref:Uncharacterized protein n=1 Tax=Marinithermofilum abyssi TaxID=1571185 RepID=A0A8J2YDN0_9BACL|nr:hypothetical protein [Marinithermofilum abyssi]GGE12122.1 hypothetical protein GCM10011571_11870 [Marinithermofilum abyssi]
MDKVFSELHPIFSRTKASIETFVQMLEPVVEQAATEKERLYFHHIIEEEEQRLERLETLLPRLEKLVDSNIPVQHSKLSPWSVGNLRFKGE